MKKQEKSKLGSLDEAIIALLDKIDTVPDDGIHTSQNGMVILEKSDVMNESETKSMKHKE